MTRPHGYIRFEARGLWQETANAEPSEVIVKLNGRTVVLTDFGDTILGHWARNGLVPQERDGDKVTYALSDDGSETLVITDRDMNAALLASWQPDPQQPRARTRRKFPLRMVLTLTLGAGLVAAIATLGPRVIRSQTERLIPPESAAELSDRILLVLMDQGARPLPRRNRRTQPGPPRRGHPAAGRNTGPGPRAHP